MPVDDDEPEPPAEDHDDPVDDDEPVDDEPEPPADDHDDPVDDEPVEDTEPPEDEEPEPPAADEDDRQDPAEEQADDEADRADDQADDERAEAEEQQAEDQADDDRADAEEKRAEDDADRVDADEQQADDEQRADEQKRAEDDADRADADQQQADQQQADDDRPEEANRTESDDTTAEANRPEAEDRTEPQDNNPPPDEKPADEKPADEQRADEQPADPPPDDTERERELKLNDPRWDGDWSQSLSQQPGVDGVHSFQRESAQQHLSPDVYKLKATSDSASGIAAGASADYLGPRASMEIGSRSTPLEMSKAADKTSPGQERTGPGAEPQPVHDLPPLNPGNDVPGELNPRTEVPTPEPAQPSVENPPRHDVPPINPGEELTEQLNEDNPDVATPDTTGQVMEASDSSTERPSGSGEVEKKSGEQDADFKQRAQDTSNQVERQGEAFKERAQQMYDKVERQSDEYKGTPPARTGEDADEVKKVDESEQARAEATIEVTAGLAEEEFSDEIPPVGELGDSGASGPLVQAALAFRRDGWEPTKHIVAGKIDGLKKSIADKEKPGGPSDQFKQRAEDRAAENKRQGEEFQQRSQDRYDRAGLGDSGDTGGDEQGQGEDGSDGKDDVEAPQGDPDLATPDPADRPAEASNSDDPPAGGGDKGGGADKGGGKDGGGKGGGGKGGGGDKGGKDGKGGKDDGADKKDDKHDQAANEATTEYLKRGGEVLLSGAAEPVGQVDASGGLSPAVDAAVNFARDGLKPTIQIAQGLYDRVKRQLTGDSPKPGETSGADESKPVEGKPPAGGPGDENGPPAEPGATPPPEKPGGENPPPKGPDDKRD